MNKDQILGLVRHLLTASGTIFITKGFIDESTATQIVGGFVALLSVVWSFRTKKTA